METNEDLFDQNFALDFIVKCELSRAF